MTHRRAEPAHRFDSQVALPLLFLDELAELRAVHPLVDLDPSPHRRRWPAAMRFHRDDYLPRTPATVRGAVEEAVAGAGGSVRGPVAMLGHVRTWGWLFNPLTLYYCFDPSGREVEWTVLEVSNTPWHERCSYVVGPPGRAPLRQGHARLALPARPGHLHLALLRARGQDPGQPRRRCAAAVLRRMVGRTSRTPTRPRPRLAASMVLRRRPLDRAGLARLLWAYPFMTARVSGGIYAQALRLVGARRPDPPAPRPVGPCPSSPSAAPLAGQEWRGPTMSRVSGRLVLGLARDPLGAGRGRCASRASGCPGARPLVSGIGRPRRHDRGARREDMARRPAPRLARLGRELHRRMVGHRRPHRGGARRLPPHRRPPAVPGRDGAPLRWLGGGGTAAPAAEQER